MAMDEANFLVSYLGNALQSSLAQATELLKNRDTHSMSYSSWQSPQPTPSLSESHHQLNPSWISRDAVSLGLNVSTPPTLPIRSVLGERSSAQYSTQIQSTTPAPFPSAPQQPADIPVVDLSVWCPLDLYPDGDCTLAGLNVTHTPDLAGTFVKSARVATVSGDGRTILCEDGRRYNVGGPISIQLYLALNPTCPKIAHLPRSLKNAFQDGFPSLTWRKWTQGLYYYLNGLVESSKENILPDIAVDASKRSTQCKKLTTKPYRRDPYSKILPYVSPLDLDKTVSESSVTIANGDGNKSPNSDTNVESVSENAAPIQSFLNRRRQKCDGALHTDAHIRQRPRDRPSESCCVSKPKTRGGPRKLPKPPVTDNPEDSSVVWLEDMFVDQPGRSNSDSHNAARLSDNGTASTSHRSDKFESSSSSDSDHSSFSTKPVRSLFSGNQMRSKPPHRRSFKSPKDKPRVKPARGRPPVQLERSSKSHRRKSSTQDALGTSLWADHEVKEQIPHQYKLYTADGRVVDVRKLVSRRSGRLSLPKADPRRNQCIYRDSKGELKVRSCDRRMDSC